MNAFTLDGSKSIILVKDGKNYPALVFPNALVGIYGPKEYFSGGGELQVFVMVGKVTGKVVAALEGLRLGKDYHI